MNSSPAARLYPAGDLADFVERYEARLRAAGALTVELQRSASGSAFVLVTASNREALERIVRFAETLHTDLLAYEAPL